jgi:hypothetical protein
MRRHTTDHTARASTTSNTPSASRSSSVASNRSEPSWFTAYNGLDTSNTRRDSKTPPKLSPRNSSSRLTQKPGTSNTSGWKALFNSESREKRKKEKQKEVDKIVLGSRHAAAVKTRLAMDPKYAEQRRNSADSGVGLMSGTPQPSNPHLTATEQGIRFPHSGPPALKGGEKGSMHRKGKKGVDVTADMPALTRIVSGDENDEEEDRARLGREDWVRRRDDAAMRGFTVAEGVGEDEDDEEGSGSEEEERVQGKVMEVEGTRVIGAELEGDAYAPRAKTKGPGIGIAWRRREDGKWTR